MYGPASGTDAITAVGQPAGPQCENAVVKRPHYLLVGLAAYLLALASMAAFVGFLAGFAVPWRLDAEPSVPWSRAVGTNLALIASFALLHSLLARASLRDRLLAAVPSQLVRSVYSLVAGAQIILLLAGWRPIPALVWHLEAGWARATAWSAFALGWGVVVAALPALGSARLFGLRQAWEAAWGRSDVAPAIEPRGIYRHIRHPLYAGTILGMFAAPEMSAGHLLLAASLTLYTLAGARLEERDLMLRADAGYVTYRRQVPAYLPSLRRTLSLRDDA